MWVFTPDGFYSVVQKKQDAKNGMLTVRTRNRADIDALVKNHFPDAKPYAVRASDYAWRIRVPAALWADALAAMALEIDYSNFKDEVTKRQGWKRHDVYLRVWVALLSLRDPVKRSRRRRGKGGGEPLWQDWRDETLTDYDVDRLLGGGR